ncbi:MAG: hypothetical protein CMJ22_11390 [Phycisphaerae bacterium]|nr:hypothetical protein [Phycisphaerae bacterium]
MKNAAPVTGAAFGVSIEASSPVRSNVSPARTGPTIGTRSNSRAVDADAAFHRTADDRAVHGGVTLRSTT